MSIPASQILDCEIGDVIEWTGDIGKTYFALIIGQKYYKNHDRWLVQPLQEGRDSLYIKKIATVWKKVT